MQAAIINYHGQMQRSPLPEKKAIEKSPAVARKCGGSNMNGVKAEGLHANRIRPIKITAVGDGMVGKTCMLITYTQKQFPKEYVPTVFDNYADNIIVDEQEFNMTLWDTAGQEDYERLRPLSYPNTDCFLLCYSVASRSSYENIVSKWYPEIRHHCPTVPIVLVATKIDLREEDEQEIISENEGKVLKRRIKAAKYMECSAKNMQGLREVFVEAIRTVMKKPPPPKRICAIL